jgi:hypothetical protein
MVGEMAGGIARSVVLDGPVMRPAHTREVLAAAMLYAGVLVATLPVDAVAHPVLEHEAATA